MQEIIGYLDATRGQIDNTINREHAIIKLLQELRTSLISEVVTGKIDVATIDPLGFENPTGLGSIQTG